MWLIEKCQHEQTRDTLSPIIIFTLVLRRFLGDTRGRTENVQKVLLLMKVDTETWLWLSMLTSFRNACGACDIVPGNKTFRPPQSRMTAWHNIMTGDCNIDLAITLSCNLRTSMSVEMTPIVIFWLVIIIKILWRGSFYLGLKFFITLANNTVN